MSYIPSSAMPHAKPHDEHDHDHKPDQAQHDSGADAGKPQAAPAAPTPSAERQGSESPAAPWGIALAIGGVVAVGAAATAFAFRGRRKAAKKVGGKQSPSAKNARKTGKKAAA